MAMKFTNNHEKKIEIRKTRKKNHAPLTDYEIFSNDNKIFLF